MFDVATNRKKRAGWRPCETRQREPPSSLYPPVATLQENMLVWGRVGGSGNTLKIVEHPFLSSHHVSALIQCFPSGG